MRAIKSSFDHLGGAAEPRRHAPDWPMHGPDIPHRVPVPGPPPALCRDREDDPACFEPYPPQVAGMGLLDGKVAIVTGAGRGIGRGEALELAREGARGGQRARRRGRQGGGRRDRCGGRRGGARHRRLLRGRHRARTGRDGGRQLRAARRAGQQRGHPARPDRRQDERRRVGLGDQGPPARPFPADPSRLHLLEGLRAAGPHRLHGVDLRAARQLRPDQLRRGQGRASRPSRRSSRWRWRGTACGATRSPPRPAPG